MWHLLLVFPLTGIVVQDFKSRSYALYWPVLVALGIGMQHYTNGSWPSFFPDSALINLLFLAIQLCVLLGYAYLKTGDIKALFRDMLGIGDVVVWGLMAMYFEWKWFMGLFMVGIILTLVIEGLRRKYRPVSEATIPLAGYQSIFWILCIIIQTAV